MFLIDSCGWLEYFSDSSRADKYAAYLHSQKEIIVPAIVLYEVYKKIKATSGEEKALLVVSQMEFFTLTEFKPNDALFAADLSLKFNLPMADAIIYATALTRKALIVTSDEHFKNLDQVNFIA